MIIKSILDNDLYKLTMQQAVIAIFPDEIVRYELIIRTRRQFPKGFKEILEAEIRAMGDLKLSRGGAIFLKKECPYLKPPYIDFLRGYRFDRHEVRVNQVGDELRLEIEGPWYRAILWEVPLMALISELYFKSTGQEAMPIGDLYKKTITKIERIERIGARFMDFGTRRRFSYNNQNMVVKMCTQYAPKTFIGTSNIYLARDYNCKVGGTQAHEWYMLIATLYGYESANMIGMEKWVDVYQGDLGIVLTDTFTTDDFFSKFNTKYAKLFDGIRQDSGDPIVFAEKAIRCYKELRIDPLNKTIVFSDGLDADAVERIHEFCKGKIRDAYGIGTNLSNDVDVTPMNMVIKLTAVKKNGAWKPTVKLSDEEGKHTGPKYDVDLCKQILNIT